mgnify:CR=1 FL=1
MFVEKKKKTTYKYVPIVIYPVVEHKRWYVIGGKLDIVQAGGTVLTDSQIGDGHNPNVALDNFKEKGSVHR